MEVAGYYPAKLNNHDQSTIAVKTAAMHVTCRFMMTRMIMMIHLFVVAGLADATMLQQFVLQTGAPFRLGCTARTYCKPLNTP